MVQENKTYLFLILLHVAIGIGLYYIPGFPKIYGYGIILYGVYYALVTKNKDNVVLYAAAYIVGSEIVLRITNGNPIYEFSKYGVIAFILIGTYYSGLSKNAVPYWIYIVLLIPGIIIATYSLGQATDLRKEISFSMSGPVCLGLCSMYTYARKVTLKQISDILLLVGLPIISCTVFLILYTPSIRDVITGTGSSSATSGGFGPNQVSTVLGLGMFIFISRMLFNSPSKFLLILNGIIAINISFRGLVTFSRGGMITGLLMLVSLFFFTYFKVNRGGKAKMNFMLIIISMLMMGTWLYSASETSGLINKRYANQDAGGRVKESRFTGREQIAEDEINDFLNNPILGVGVGVNSDKRFERTGLVILSHNEITRMIAEHGSLGIMCLIILFLTPLFLYLDNKDNIYLVAFITFWLLTINHAAMRLAMPAFIYSLSLLKVVPDEKSVVHRE